MGAARPKRLYENLPAPLNSVCSSEGKNEKMIFFLSNFDRKDERDSTNNHMSYCVCKCL